MININQKGNVAMVVVMLASALIGLVVLSGFTSGFCEGCLAQTSFTQTNTDQTAGTWYNNTCVGEKCATGYSLTCNSTELEAGVDYSIDDCDFRLENAAYNDTTCVLAYTAVTSETNDDGILGTIICLLPVLIALGILVAAIAWAALG